MKHRILALWMTIVVLFLALVPAVPVKAADTYDIPLEVTFCQTEARKEFNMVNSFRTGDEAWYWNEDNTTKTTPNLQNLKYDYNLEKVAMQRAVEIALYYDHERADGQRCWKTYGDCGYSYSTAGENIACGFGNAAAVFNAWKETNKQYNGQGHRRNMLNSAFTECGFGCVKYEGTYYWVQEFARGGSSSYTETVADNSTRTKYAKISEDNMECFYIDDIALQKGTTTDLSNEKVTMEVVGRENPGIVVVKIAPEWEVSDSSIASITNNKLKANKVGTTTLTANCWLGNTCFTTRSQVEVVDTDITVSPSTIQVRVGGECQITGTITPNNKAYSYRDINWSITDESVAKISETYGLTLLVEGLKKGSTTLVAQTKDGVVRKTFPIQVVQTVTGISINGSDQIDLTVGDTAQLSATVLPEDASDKEIEWSSDDTNVVTVSENGLITAQSAGGTWIRATAKDKYNSSSYKPYSTVWVNVSNPDPVVAFVSRMYTVALGREAEEAGLNDWVWQLRTGTNDGAGLAHGFIESTEFTNKNLSNEDYLTVLYHTFFDRDPDEGGFGSWLSQLNSGASRRHVLAGFVNSQEFTNLCDRYGIYRGTLEDDGQRAGDQNTNAQVRAFVERMYVKALGRQGEEDGINSWTQRIVSGEWAAADVAKAGFFNSQEYATKNRSNEEFVEDLYQALFDRASDEDGKADWLTRLDNGASREDVMNGFGGSQEFRNMLAGFGL